MSASSVRIKSDEVDSESDENELRDLTEGIEAACSARLLFNVSLILELRSACSLLASSSSRGSNILKKLMHSDESFQELERQEALLLRDINDTDGKLASSNRSAPSFMLPRRRDLLPHRSAAEREAIEHQPHDAWNRKSNDWAWSTHPIKREAAEQSASLHAYSKRTPMYIKGSTRPSESGLLPYGESFVARLGYDLGDVDREGRAVKVPWRRVDRDSNFRTEADYKIKKENRKITDDNTEGDVCEYESCQGWTAYDHTVRREAAKISSRLHMHSARSLTNCPTDDLHTNPAAVYSLKYRKFGEAALRAHHSARDYPREVVRDIPFSFGTANRR